MTRAAELVPIGYYMGALYDVQVDAPDHWRLRIGRELIHLNTVDAVSMWLLSQGVNKDGEPSAARDDVLEQAIQLDVLDPEEQLAKLLETECVVEVGEGALSDAEFARRYRAEPLMAGLGNAPDALDRFAVGIDPRSIGAVLSQFDYHVWMFTHLRPSIFDAAREVTELDFAGEMTDADLAEYVDAVLRLVRMGAVYLDQATAAG